MTLAIFRGFWAPFGGVFLAEGALACWESSSCVRGSLLLAPTVHGCASTSSAVMRQSGWTLSIPLTNSTSLSLDLSVGILHMACVKASLQTALGSWQSRSSQSSPSILEHTWPGLRDLELELPGVEPTSNGHSPWSIQKRTQPQAQMSEARNCMSSAKHSGAAKSGVRTCAFAEPSLSASLCANRKSTRAMSQFSRSLWHRRCSGLMSPCRMHMECRCLTADINWQ
mmetsp:Transcript_40490/g.120057  ORF Transcript_40490/g.120057 Transcript_40490/m.120057 type:complete len:226 (+) Transcript_40490:106-783(+)